MLERGGDGVPPCGPRGRQWSSRLPLFTKPSNRGAGLRPHAPTQHDRRWDACSREFDCGEDSYDAFWQQQLEPQPEHQQHQQQQHQQHHHQQQQQQQQNQHCGFLEQSGYEEAEGMHGSARAPHSPFERRGEGCKCWSCSSRVRFRSEDSEGKSPEEHRSWRRDAGRRPKDCEHDGCRCKAGCRAGLRGRGSLSPCQSDSFRHFSRLGPNTPSDTSTSGSGRQGLDELRSRDVPLTAWHGRQRPAPADKQVSLRRWFLVRCDDKEAEDVVDATNPRVAVGGMHTSESFELQTVRSTMIVERIEKSRLRTKDGVEIRLMGCIDAETTVANGFSVKVVHHFLTGFPFVWKHFLELFLSNDRTPKSDIPLYMPETPVTPDGAATGFKFGGREGLSFRGVGSNEVESPKTVAMLSPLPATQTPAAQTCVESTETEEVENLNIVAAMSSPAPATPTTCLESTEKEELESPNVVATSSLLLGAQVCGDLGCHDAQLDRQDETGACTSQLKSKRPRKGRVPPVRVYKLRSSAGELEHGLPDRLGTTRKRGVKRHRDIDTATGSRIMDDNDEGPAGRSSTNGKEKEGQAERSGNNSCGGLERQMEAPAEDSEGSDLEKNIGPSSTALEKDGGELEVRPPEGELSNRDILIHVREVEVEQPPKARGSCTGGVELLKEAYMVHTEVSTNLEMLGPSFIASSKDERGLEDHPVTQLEDEAQLEEMLLDRELEEERTGDGEEEDCTELVEVHPDIEQGDSRELEEVHPDRQKEDGRVLEEVPCDMQQDAGRELEEVPLDIQWDASTEVEDVLVHIQQDAGTELEDLHLDIEQDAGTELKEVHFDLAQDADRELEEACLDRLDKVGIELEEVRPDRGTEDGTEVEELHPDRQGASGKKLGEVRTELEQEDGSHLEEVHPDNGWEGGLALVVFQDRGSEGGAEPEEHPHVGKISSSNELGDSHPEVGGCKGVKRPREETVNATKSAPTEDIDGVDSAGSDKVSRTGNRYTRRGSKKRNCKVTRKNPTSEGKSDTQKQLASSGCQSRRSKTSMIPPPLPTPCVSVTTDLVQQAYGLKTSRSGRLLVPPLAYWRNQTTARDKDGGIIAIMDGFDENETPDTGCFNFEPPKEKKAVKLQRQLQQAAEERQQVTRGKASKKRRKAVAK